MKTTNDIDTHRPRPLWDVYDSPLGPLTVVTGRRGLTDLHFPDPAPALDEDDRAPTALAAASAQLEGYFAGDRQAFDLDLDLAGTTLQRRVWQELQRIPFGTTVSYTELARAVGRPDSVRAVAAAVGRTPVPIIVPCHRVVAADGALTGYRGGLERKQALLDRERSAAAV
jgi:methylated-DNA-[protein]-cysteine S-methyltransferase